MTDRVLRQLDITNFRSIRGHIHAPLDAKVVLVHGENGAGKTSLLSAVELALTGSVESLRRADAGYATQLLHRTAQSGGIVLDVMFDQVAAVFETELDANGATSAGLLDRRLSSFFGERAYLPQSLLGQLLQIYQDSGSDKDSPLARFVGNLLGLDRLDALEAGLQPLNDVRNVRKITSQWATAETDQTRVNRLIDGQIKSRNDVNDRITAVLARLKVIVDNLGQGPAVAENTLDAVTPFLSEDADERALESLTDQIRDLGSIEREITEARRQGDETPLEDVGTTSADFAAWDEAYGQTYRALRVSVETLLPEVTLPTELGEFAGEAKIRLRAMAQELGERAAQARKDETRRTAAQQELKQAEDQRDAINQEVSSLSADSGSLASALSELTSFIDSDMCPVCDRNFAEMDQSTLSEHVQAKVRRLSGSAERLLSLGRSGGEAQTSIERLEREIEYLSAKVLTSERLAELDRNVTRASDAAAELEAMSDILEQGGRLLGREIGARRAASDAQSRNVALLAARETLRTFSRTVGVSEVTTTEPLGDAATRLHLHLMAETKRLGERLNNRRQGAELVATIRSSLDRRSEIDASIASDSKALAEIEGALYHAQAIREQGQTVRRAVDTVRSAIIRREFNDRLNKLWRDLFVRLAPGEPFVPAFRIPEGNTQRLQPKLITEDRLGSGSGGTPGAMLSAGNLNTAALTLFIALHLSVPAELPLLILDDPVQSMDDVHIAHFAALLRTLSNEHGRQVMVAVHDRQLFEYLRLELSPSTPNDSLITLELSRGPRRDTLCSHERLTYREETALLAA